MRCRNLPRSQSSACRSKDDVDGGRVGAGPLIGAAYSWVVELLCYCVTEYYFVRERAFHCIASFHCTRVHKLTIAALVTVHRRLVRSG